MNLSRNELISLEQLKIEAIKCQTLANYWIAFATTESNYKRVVLQGDTPMSKTQLEGDAFYTALNHIKRLDDIQAEIKRVLS